MTFHQGFEKEEECLSQAKKQFVQEFKHFFRMLKGAANGKIITFLFQDLWIASPAPNHCFFP